MWHVQTKCQACFCPFVRFYNQWNLQCVDSLVQEGWNEELLFHLTGCRVCILSGVGLNEKKENCYFCDPDECCFLMLSALHSFYAYPTLEVKFLLSVGSLQKRRISQHFSLSLSVIRNRLCLLSFSKTKRRSTALSFPFLIWWWFQSDLSAAVDVWPIVLASVSKCFWQVSVKDRPQG